MDDVAARSGLDHAEGRAAIAATILERRTILRDTWLSLVSEQTRPADGGTVSPEMLDVAVLALAKFLESADLAIPAQLGTLWERDMLPSRELVAASAVSISMLGEAARVTFGDDITTLTAISVALPDFCGELVRALVAKGDVSPGEQHWIEVSRQLAEDRERRITQLAILNEVTQALSTTLTLDDLYDTIYAQCGRLIDVTLFYIGTISDDEPGKMAFQVSYVNGERIVDTDPYPRQLRLSQIVIDSGKPLLVDDYVQACRERGIEPSSAALEWPTLAWLGVPIICGNRPIGVMTIGTTQGPLDPDDVEIFTAIARQAGAAVDNSRLYEEQRTQAQQLRAINQLSRTIATIREPLPLMDQAAALIREMFGYSVVAFLTADPSGNELVLRAQAGIVHGEQLVGLKIKVGGQGIVSHAAAAREVILVEDVTNDPRYLITDYTREIRSEIAVPLLRDGRLLGLIDVESPQVGAFSEHDVEILTTIADQLAVALENAELFHEEYKRRKEVALMLKVSQAANSSLVLDHVLQAVAEGLADAVGQPTCVIYLYDDEGDRLLPSAFVARDGSLLDTAMVSRLAPHPAGSTLLQEAMCCDEGPFAIEMECCDLDDELPRMLSASAVLVVPFMVQGRILGIGLVAAHDVAYHFSPAQIRLAAGVASAAALALENSRLYARSHTLGMAEERIRVAREIHDGMAQGLTAITLQLEAADQMFANKPEKARAKISRALELTRANLEEARRSVLDLRASALQELTLSEALHRRMLQFNDQHRERGISGSFTGADLHGRLSSRVELSLFRVFEEALDNAAKHSSATHVDATLTRDGDVVTLTVRDNGQGFDVAGALSGTAAPGAFGLVAIRERIRLLHGTFSISSEPGAGATLRVSVPFEPHREHEVFSERASLVAGLE